MSKTYFNVWEFKQALDLAEMDPISARVLYEQYLEKYPKDYAAYPYYCSNLITLGELDLAEKKLNYIVEQFKKDDNIKDFDKTKIFEHNIFFCKIKLMSYQKRYKELNNIYKNNPNPLKDRNFNTVWFYTEKQLGNLDVEKRDSNSYLFRQITKYDEQDFLDHIKKHLAEYNDNSIEPNSNVFEPNFPIEEVLEEIKKYIPSNKKLLYGFFDDTYVFKYSNCGRVDSRLVDYFKVICLHDSTDLITICPVRGNDNIPHVDLNYMVKEENGKVKRKSQIERFNQKYNQN
ncbi:MAG: tetratricopeptide repeat protein [Firmicutes bacterium]|nr:tetratricopeptide repeat protein [Bacillota bacterium]